MQAAKSGLRISSPSDLDLINRLVYARTLWSENTNVPAFLV
jgi:hypothetical protein